MKTAMARFWAVVPAAGVGKRMGGPVPKQYLQIAGQPVLQHTLQRLLSVERIAGVVVALSPDDGYWADLPVSADSRIRIAAGGQERADSVLSALDTLSQLARSTDWVLVHDAARPCVRPADIDHLMDTLADHAVGGILAVPVSDTLKQVESLAITATLDRTLVWRAQTPQMFRLGLLREALIRARALGQVVTDEASALELQGYRPGIVEGQADNIKITRPEDMALATFYLEQRSTTRHLS